MTENLNEVKITITDEPLTEAEDDADDCPELTSSQIEYLLSLQERCDRLVSDPESEYYEPRIENSIPADNLCHIIAD